MSESRTDTPTLIAAMRELAATIQCDDGVANAAILEAAERLQELSSGEPVYRMKPLEWCLAHSVNGFEVWIADCADCRYQVCKYVDGKTLAWISVKGEKEKCHKCDSIAHGKQLAEDHYRLRWLETAVEVVPEKKLPPPPPCQGPPIYVGGF